MTNKRCFALSPLCHALILVALLPESHAYAAANFSITVKAGTTLPTTIIQGQTVTAYYTITNKTKTARNGYLLAGLPGTVAQNTAVANCQKVINLNAYASCTLQLDITGPAHSNFAICKQSSCTTAAVPLNVTMLSTTNLVAAGLYTATNTTEYPLLAQSMNTGAWTYPINSNPATLPSGFSNYGYFNSAGCSGNICIAGGDYSTVSAQYPLLANSNNGGTTWNYPSTIITNLPSDYAGYAFFISVSCNGNTCIAAGEDYNGSGLPLLLAQSNDAGTTWNYPIGGPGTLPPDFNNSISDFSAASCSNQACVAAGFYINNSSISYPVLAQCPIGQTNWTYRIDSMGTLPPDYARDGSFYGASCNGAICIAGGGYNNLSNSYPLLALSSNGGVTWSYPIYSGGTLPPDYDSSGVFFGVSCFESVCMAGGSYNNGTNAFPLLSQSNDGGTTWTYPVYAGGTLPPDMVYGQFNAVSCDGIICIATGNYYNGVNQFPLLAQSTNGGATWTYPVYSGGNLPPDYVSNGSFYSASCVADTCIAVGQYNNSTTTYPLLAESTDGGNTWTYPGTIISQLPSDFSSGSFAGASASASASTTLARTLNLQKLRSFSKPFGPRRH